MDQPRLEQNQDENRRKLTDLEKKIVDLGMQHSVLISNLDTKQLHNKDTIQLVVTALDRLGERLQMIESLLKIGNSLDFKLYNLKKDRSWNGKVIHDSDSEEGDFEEDEDNPHDPREEYTQKELCRIAEESPEDDGPDEDTEEPPKEKPLMRQYVGPVRKLSPPEKPKPPPKKKPKKKPVPKSRGKLRNRK